MQAKNDETRNVARINDHITSPLTGAAYSDLLVCFLPITTLFDDSHDQVFSCHEWKLLRNPASDNLGIHDQPFRHISQSREDNVCSQKPFRERHATIRTTVASVAR